MKKKLAIMGSGNGGNFEAIVKWFQGKNVQITCLSDVEDAFILKRAENLNIKNEFLLFEDNFKYFTDNKFDLVVLAGYLRILSNEVLNEIEKVGKVVNIHPSLLPAFKGSKTAIQDAFLMGVKVSGVTIHFVTSDVDGGQILAQYPVFINNDTHFDEFEAEIHQTEHKLYPIVIEKLLEDKIFDFVDLMRSSKGCGGDCSGGGCGGCNN